MNTAEAKAALTAATYADGGCTHCAAQVITQLVRRLPDAPWQEAADTFDPDSDEAIAWQGAQQELTDRKRLGV